MSHDPAPAPPRAILLEPSADNTATKRWLAPHDVASEAVEAMHVATSLQRPICRLLLARGVTTIEEARAFLKPKLEHMHDSRLLKGAEELVDRLLAARARGDRIGIHGDYDVDGISATSLYAIVLRKLGFGVSPFVPHRFIDGYGVSARAVRAWHEEGVRVILTCDTGFSAEKEIAEAVDQLGLEVLVTDHHLPPDVLPKAHALVNPNQRGCPYPNKHLCGAGVAFKTLQLLCAKMGLDEREVLHPHLDLVALPTICDVMQLEGENRVLVKYGLAQLRATNNLGLRAVLEKAGVAAKDVNEETCGFVIGPRLNAAGRLSDAAKGMDLLLAETTEKANALAAELEELNNLRKTTTRAIELAARERVDAMDLSDVYGLVLFGPEPGAGVTPEWHHGVLGIVASRMVERYGRPCFLFGYDEASQTWKGSGRAPAVGKAHLKNALDGVKAAAPHLIVKAGGHAAAAGATLNVPTEADRLAFATAFNEAVRPMLRPEERTPAIGCDVEVSLDEVTPEFFGRLQWFAPFGRGNEKVRFVARNVTVQAAKAIGGDKTHLKLSLSQNKCPPMDCIAFGFAERIPETVTRAVPYTLDICFELGTNTFRNVTSLQMEAKDISLPMPIQERDGVAAASAAPSATTRGASGSAPAATPPAPSVAASVAPTAVAPAAAGGSIVSAEHARVVVTPVAPNGPVASAGTPVAPVAKSRGASRRRTTGGARPVPEGIAPTALFGVDDVGTLVPAGKGIDVGARPIVTAMSSELEGRSGVTQCSAVAPAEPSSALTSLFGESALTSLFGVSALNDVPGGVAPQTPAAPTRPVEASDNLTGRILPAQTSTGTLPEEPGVTRSRTGAGHAPPASRRPLLA